MCTVKNKLIFSLLISLHSRNGQRSLVKNVRNTGLGVLMILKEYNLNISEVNGKASKDSQRATSQAYEMAHPMRLVKAEILQHQNQN